MSYQPEESLGVSAANQDTRDSLWSMAQSSADLFRTPITSRYRYVGGLIVLIRKTLVRLLGPLIERQVHYNAANLRLVSSLQSEVYSLAQAHNQIHTALQSAPAAAEAQPTLPPIDARWQPAIWPTWDALVPPRALWVGPNDPLIHFFRWPWEYRAYLSLLCGLQEDSAVLEIGCNHGRTAMGLLDFLQPPGRYEGLDILPEQIEFAEQHIHTAYPHFGFTLANIYNAAYNPNGQISASTYRFPYADRSFDILYAASVFTHLLPADAANYLRESRRVLRAGGTCCFSFFVQDFYRGKGSSSCELYEFEHPLANGVAVYNPAVPEHVIAYHSSVIEQMAADAGLAVTKILPGFWSKTRKDGVNEQDLVVFKAL